MFDKGGMPMYPAVILAGLTLFAWIAVMVRSYTDETPAGFEDASV